MPPSAAPRWTEKAQALVQVAEGLLVRIWALRAAIAKDASGGQQRTYATLHRDEWAKIRKRLESAFPELLDVSKVQAIAGYDSLRAGADDVIQELVGVFALVMEMLDLKNAALEVLQAVASSPNLKYVNAPQAVVAALELMAALAQVQLLWATITERKFLVSVFILAHHIKNDHRNDAYYTRVVAYIEETTTGLKSLTQTFAAMATGMGDAVQGLQDAVLTSLNPTLLRQMNAFSILEEGSGMALPVRKQLSIQSPRLQLHRELAASPRYMELVLWCGLLCPAALEKPEFLDLYKTVAVDQVVLPVFREQVIEVQSALDEVVGFQSKTFQLLLPTSGKDAKAKKVLKDAFKDHVSEMVARHRERAVYLKLELANVCHLFSDIPGLLAPKFPMVVALASMARAEVLWLLRHDPQLLTSKRGKKAATEKDTRLASPKIAELVGLLDRLSALVRGERDMIRAYYLEYLQGAHNTALRTALQPVLSSDVQGEVRAILEGLTKHIDAAKAPNGPGQDPHLRALRVGWTRVVASLVSGAGPQEGRELLIDRMNTIVTLSGYIDGFDDLLTRHFTLGPAWWWRHEVQTIFTEVLTGADDDSGVEHVLSFIRALDSATSNTHPACAQEAISLRQAAMAQASEMVDACMRRILAVTQEMSDNVLRLSLQASPLAAVERIERMSSTKTTTPTLLPGYESGAMGASTSPVTRDLKRLTHVSAMLGQAINQSPQLQVAQRVFHLKRHFVKTLDAALANHIKGLFDKNITRPSMALQSTVCFINALQRVARCVDMDLVSIVRKHLLEVGWYSNSLHGFMSLDGDKLGSRGQADNASVYLQDQARPVGRLAAFFFNFIGSVCEGNEGLVYVPSRRMFLRYNPSRGRAGSFTGPALSTGIEAELYTDERELHALVDLVGPIGVEIIDNDILSHISEHLRTIRSFLDTNSKSISAFSTTYRTISPETSVHSLASIPQLGSLLDACRKVGIGLACRTLLRHALRDRQQTAGSGLVGTLENAYGGIMDAEKMLADKNNRAARAFDRLVRLTGGDGFDTKLAQTLEQVGGDWEGWVLLVHAMAASFTSDWWKSATYLIEHDAFLANEQLALLTLVDVLRIIKAKSSAETDERKKVDVHELVNDFIRASSFVLLKLKDHACQGRALAPKASDSSTSSVNVLFVALEKFVEWCPYVDAAVLDRYLPYAVFHQCHMQLSLERQRPSDGLISLYVYAEDGLKGLEADALPPAMPGVVA